METVQSLREKTGRTFGESFRCSFQTILTLRAWDISHEAMGKNERAVKIPAGIGIPVVCILHGYAGFIFSSVKANAFWMPPLIPLIFFCSAVVSRIALCIVTYTATMEIRKLITAWQRRQYPYLPITEALKNAEIQVVTMTVRNLIMFMTLAISLELLYLIFRGTPG